MLQSAHMPQAASISVYPVKSFASARVETIRIVERGALEHDRKFALFDTAGKDVKGNRSAKACHLGISIDFKAETAQFQPSIELGEAAMFDFVSELDSMETWLSEYFGRPVSCRRELRGGFPDDKAATGPTLISDATYREVAA